MVPGSPSTAAVIGEALVDLVISSDAQVTAIPGGGPYNAARTMARLGVPTAFVGGISSDALGSLLYAGLRESGVDAAIDVRVDEPTTLAIAQLDGHGSASYRFLLDGTSAAAIDATAAGRAVAGLPFPPAALHAGTLGLVIPGLREATLALVDECPDDRLVFLDPNCRPATVRDAAAYRDTIGHALGRADVVKISTEDAAFLSPDHDWSALASHMCDRGAGVVLVTDGAEAVHVVMPGFVGSLEVPSVVVRDTVGAGDSFGGGFLAWWLRHGLGRAGLGDREAVREAARFGIRVAAMTCQRTGADPPWLHELE